MGAALDDAGRGDEGELGLLLEFGDAERTAVAHGGLDLEDGLGDVFFQGTRVGDVGVDTLFEGELLVAAQVIALPVAGAVGTLAPVLLDVGAADEELLGRALVEAGEVAAQQAPLPGPSPRRLWEPPPTPGRLRSGGGRG